MAVFSTLEDELLIDLVSNKPPLYDSQLQAYKDNTVRENNWEEIAKLLNKTSGDCKKRWKYIRDSYNRCKRKIKLPTGSQAPSKTTKWMLFERLRFLEKVPSERTSVCTVETNEKALLSDNDNEEDSEVSGSANLGKHSNINEMRMSSAGISEEETSSTGTKERRSSSVGTSGAGTESASTNRAARKRKQESTMHESLLQYWKGRDKERQAQIKALTVQEQPADVDGINSFCSHIGTILTKLTPALRVEAKTKVFNILAEYELRCLQQDSRSTSSNSQYNQSYSLANISPDETYSSASNPYSPPISLVSPQPSDCSAPSTIPKSTASLTTATDYYNASQEHYDISSESNDYFLTSM